MKKLLIASLFLLASFCGCTSGSSDPLVQVAFHEIPYKTDQFLRIGYTLKTWEYEKEGLELQQIKVLDDVTKEALYVLDKPNLPKIFKDPLDANPYFALDKLNSYYLSIQLPVALNRTPPTRVSHLLTFRRTADNATLTVGGGAFSPRTNESARVIASPLKGERLYFMNLSTNGYHFNVLLFMNGNIYRPERYAIDTMEFNPSLTSVMKDGCTDSEQNTCYNNYGRPLYAVADGVVVLIQDGIAEQAGDKKVVPFYSADDYAGNYLVLDIGGGHYAFYCHCIPGSFLVRVGDTVREGDQLASLGNSGNSDMPHLHFHISDGKVLWGSNGVPYVLKEYTRQGWYFEPGPGTPVPEQSFSNAMPENKMLLKVE